MIGLYILIKRKVKNQFTKIDRYFQNAKIKRLKKQFKFCGEDVFIQLPVHLEGRENITLGDNVSINAFVHMWGNGKINIGHNCLIASHVSINSVTHDPGILPYKDCIIEKEVNIGNNVWIGSHAVILPGVTIGDNSIIGAGAVVNKNVPKNVTVAGVPAKIIKSHP